MERERERERGCDGIWYLACWVHISGREMAEKLSGANGKGRRWQRGGADNEKLVDYVKLKKEGLAGEGLAAGCY